ERWRRRSTFPSGTSKSKLLKSSCDAATRAAVAVVRRALGPRAFVAFDASPYAVAKTLVLERMLRTGGPAATDLTLQVWFSATWTSDAQTAFWRTLTELWAENRHGGRKGGGNMPTAVLSYFHHWLLRDVSLTESRQRWFSEWKRRLYGEVGQFRDNVPKADGEREAG
ncbi:hypothetical protein VaNZ11_006936, partial [Volvox africanus]